MKNFFSLIVLVVLLSGCQFKPTVKETIKEKAEQEFSGTLEQVMKLGVPMKCQWQQNENKGTSIVKGKNVYVETQVNGKSGYVIMKDSCMWSWGGDQKQGLKVCGLEPETAATNTVEVPNQTELKARGVDVNVEYKCMPTIVSDDKFNPPADIQFMDIEKMMQGFSLPETETEE